MHSFNPIKNDYSEKSKSPEFKDDKMFINMNKHDEII
jgi:hypothetical protein